MNSKRRIAKQRKMLVTKVIKQIKKYQIPFDYKYGGGYFVFTFDGDEFNLHVTFRQLPMMRFGIWKIKSYGDKKWYFFAECFPYIDKFKPSCSTFLWDSLESMMEWVVKCIKEPKFYISELERVCCSECSYKPSNFSDILKDYAEELYADDHNGFNQEEYNTHLRAFNRIISELDTQKYDIFWRKSSCFHYLYDVYYYPDESVTDEEINELESNLQNCKCFSLQWRCLPPHFFKYKHLYKYKIHPGNHILYFNQKKHLRYFNRPDKS